MSDPSVLLCFPIAPDRTRASGDRRFCEMVKLLRQLTPCLTFCSTGSWTYPLVIPEVTERFENDAKARWTTWQPVLHALRLRRYDIVIVSFWHEAEWIIPLVRQHQPWAKVVVDSVDVHFVREAAGLELGIGDAAEYERRKANEVGTYQSADAVIVITHEDAKSVVAAGVTRPLFLLPNIVAIRPKRIAARSKNVLFIGAFSHVPNTDGIAWFTRECWPLVRRAVGSAILEIVGASAGPAIQQLGDTEGVRFVGYVKDTEPYLDRAAVSIAPLRFGAGMKGKVCEAMASGVPVVTTRCGAEGLGITTGMNAIVADDAVSFAEAVIKILENPELGDRIGIAGQNLVAELCSAKSAEKVLGEILQ